MSFDSIAVLVLAIIFIASLTRAIFGFGDALIAMPLLALVVSRDVSRPLVAMISVVISAAVIATDFKSIRFATVWRLIVAAAIGIPVGFYLLSQISEVFANVFLGLLVISFALYNLLRPRLYQLTTDRSSWLFGLAAGAIGAAYNTPGPLIVIFGTLRRWPPQEFRASMQGYLLPTASLILLGHFVEGRCTSLVLWYFAASLPVVLLAVFLGRLLSRKFRDEAFRRAIFILLFGIGALLLINSLWTFSQDAPPQNEARAKESLSNRAAHPPVWPIEHGPVPGEITEEPHIAVVGQFESEWFWTTSDWRGTIETCQNAQARRKSSATTRNWLVMCSIASPPLPSRKMTPNPTRM